jgi:S1-C subfamily serine protease
VLAVVLVTLALVASTADARPWSWLGVRIRDLSEQEMEEIAARHGIREGFGVVIVEVIADTPAARAGIRNGDIVVAFGERPVVETRLLQRLIAAAPVDAESKLTVLRADGRRALRVRLTSMPPNVAGDRVAAEFGFALQESLPQGEPGGSRPASTVPAVSVVIRGGAADKAGLAIGDVILQIGDRPVITRDAVREALAEQALDRPLALTIRRGEGRLPLTLPVP